MSPGSLEECPPQGCIIVGCGLLARHLGDRLVRGGEVVTYEVGVKVIQPSLATALAMEGAVHFPSTFEILKDLSYGMELTNVLLLNRRFVSRPLGRIPLPGNVKVLGIKRQQTAIAAEEDILLELGDILILVGRPEMLRRVHGFVPEVKSLTLMDHETTSSLDSYR